MKSSTFDGILSKSFQRTIGVLELTSIKTKWHWISALQLLNKHASAHNLHHKRILCLCCCFKFLGLQLGHICFVENSNYKIRCVLLSNHDYFLLLLKMAQKQNVIGVYQSSVDWIVQKQKKQTLKSVQTHMFDTFIPLNLSVVFHWNENEKLDERKSWNLFFFVWLSSN